MAYYRLALGSTHSFHWDLWSSAIKRPEGKPGSLLSSSDSYMFMARCLFQCMDNVTLEECCRQGRVTVSDGTYLTIFQTEPSDIGTKPAGYSGNISIIRQVPCSNLGHGTE